MWIRLLLIVSMLVVMAVAGSASAGEKPCTNQIKGTIPGTARPYPRTHFCTPIGIPEIGCILDPDGC